MVKRRRFVAIAVHRPQIRHDGVAPRPKSTCLGGEEPGERGQEGKCHETRGAAEPLLDRAREPRAQHEQQHDVDGVGGPDDEALAQVGEERQRRPDRRPEAGNAAVGRPQVPEQQQHEHDEERLRVLPARVREQVGPVDRGEEAARHGGGAPTAQRAGLAPGQPHGGETQHERQRPEARLGRLSEEGGRPRLHPEPERRDPVRDRDRRLEQRRRAARGRRATARRPSTQTSSNTTGSARTASRRNRAPGRGSGDDRSRLPGQRRGLGRAASPLRHLTGRDVAVHSRPVLLRRGEDVVVLAVLAIRPASTPPPRRCRARRSSPRRRGSGRRRCSTRPR